MEMNVSPDNRGAVEIPSAIFAMGGERVGGKTRVAVSCRIQFSPGNSNGRNENLPWPRESWPSLSPYILSPWLCVNPPGFAARNFPLLGPRAVFLAFGAENVSLRTELFSLTRPFIGAQKSKVRGSNSLAKATAAIKAGLYVPTFKVSSRSEISHLKRV